MEYIKPQRTCDQIKWVVAVNITIELDLLIRYHANLLACNKHVNYRRTVHIHATKRCTFNAENTF